MTFKNILVIGAAGDVGQGIAGQLLHAGHHVIAAGRSADKLRFLQQRLDQADAMKWLAGSVETEASAAKLREKVRSLTPQLDGVVVSVNAPVRPAAMADVDSNRLLEVLRTNLAAHLIAARTFIPVLPADALYLAIGGGMADTVFPGMGLLSVCQAAQRAMFRVLAAEMQASGVRIRELMLYSMIAGESNRAVAQPKWITADDVGRHVVAILDHPAWFPEPILSLKSRNDAGLPPVSQAKAS